ncbi:MAG: VWA domain-containing protein [Capsulimonadales bacterium]|nr:VWA domain-containing protein [Capsulimonadales bacterium]
MLEPEHPESQNAEPEEIAPRRLPSSPRWWLPFALLISLGLHLLMGVVAVRTGFLIPPTVADAQPETVRLVIPRRSDRADPEGTDGRTPTPVPTPRPVLRPTPAPVPSPSPTPLPPEEPDAVPVPVPSPPPRRLPVTKTSPTPLPRPTARPSAGANLPNRLPIPLPRGQADGNRETPPNEEPDTRIVARPDAPPSPLPPAMNDTEAGKPPEPAPATVAAVPDPTANTPIGEVKTGKETGTETDSGTGIAPGVGAGAGRANDLGIVRGIPFGSELGLTRGGNPNGGGGIGRGAGGGTRGGVPRFTLARPSRPEDGPPVRIVYVIDTSGSMEEGGKMERVRSAMVQALSELRPEDAFNIIFFSNEATTFSKTLRPATNANISAGVTSVSVMIPHGQTNFQQALDLAFRDPEVTHVFFMSDGEPTEGMTDFAEIVELARQRNRHQARIITLALGLGEKFKGMTLLRQLAEAGRGKFDYVDLSKSKR